MVLLLVGDFDGALTRDGLAMALKSHRLVLIRVKKLSKKEYESLSNSLSSRLASLISEVVSLEQQITSLSNEKQSSDTLAHERLLEIVALRDRILFLEWKIAELEVKVPSPPTPASFTPDTQVTVLDKIYSPSGPGEFWAPSGEFRWAWDINKEVRLVLDAKENPDNGPDQCRFFFQRAWTDLPLDTLPVELPVKVAIDGEERFSGPVRVHHHQRTPKTFNRLPFPDVDLTPFVKLGIFPNYDLSSISLPSVKEMSTYLWDQWEKLNPTADQWSERYGVAVRNWVGGIPLSNEASMLAPWDIQLAFGSNTESSLIWNRLFDICYNTWESSGNYAIHFCDRETGLSCRPDSKSFSSVPMINPDNLPTLIGKNGKSLPRGDIAHDFGLVSLAALVTRERFFVEELESWTLLGPLGRSEKHTPPRSSGIYFSGQIRSNAWFLRNLYFLYLSLPDSERRIQVREQLVRNIKYLNDTFANPSSPLHYKTGLLDFTSPYREVPWTQNTARNKNFLILSGNHHFLVHVLNEIRHNREFSDLVMPILLHVLRSTEGIWKYSPNPYLTPWLQHAATTKQDSWPEIMANTFSKSVPSPTKLIDPSSVMTVDIAAWYRAAIVAGVELGQAWASEALKWIDQAIKDTGRKPSIAWMINPRT